MALLDGMADYLDSLGLVTYRPAGTDGDVFLEHLPQEPDSVTTLFLYGGDEADAKLGYDHPLLQVRTRAGLDSAPSRQRNRAIYDALHGLAGVTLPDGTLVVNCIGVQSEPMHIGVDAVGRHEHALNYEIETRNPNRE